MVQITIPRRLAQADAAAAADTFIVPYWTIDDRMAKASGRTPAYGVVDGGLSTGEREIPVDLTFARNIDLREVEFELNPDDRKIVPMNGGSRRLRFAFVTADTPLDAARVVNTALAQQLAKKSARHGEAIGPDGLMSARDRIDRPYEQGERSVRRTYPPRVGAVDVLNGRGERVVLTGTLPGGDKGERIAFGGDSRMAGMAFRIIDESGADLSLSPSERAAYEAQRKSPTDADLVALNNTPVVEPETGPMAWIKSIARNVGLAQEQTAPAPEARTDDRSQPRMKR